MVLLNMKKDIEWDKLKEAFYHECTTETPRQTRYKKISQPPEIVFNWFKNEINEYLNENK